MKNIISKKMVTSFAMVGVLLFSGLASGVLAAFIQTNGSFETGTTPGVFVTIGTSATDITDWNITSGSVDYIGSYWQAAEGTRSIDLSGSSDGSISQNISTVSGASYVVTFDMAGNPDGGPTTKTLTVSTGGAPTSYSFDATGKSLSAMGWAPQAYTFTATGTTTILTFTSTVGSPWGPAIDNVKVDSIEVTPSPTPSASPLPSDKEACKKDGWTTYGVFNNQGDCVSYVTTGGTNPPANQ